MEVCRSSCSSPVRPLVASAVATALLSKFEALDAHNRKLEFENSNLRQRIFAKEAKHKASNEDILERSLAFTKRFSQNTQHVGVEEDGSFKSFCYQLAAMDLMPDVQLPGVRLALDELFTSVHRQEVSISKKGTRLLQQYSIVRVYLLANIAGSERCLIEHDRFDLKNGQQQTLMIPLEVRMLAGETWREAATRGLQLMVGLSPEWQEKYVEFDESSLISFTEQGSPSGENVLRSMLSVVVNELHAKLKQGRAEEERKSETRRSSREKDGLVKIGLPNGRDFYTREDSCTTVHVWCWKTREYERNGRMKAFEEYLAEHGVDTSKLGVGNNKTLFKFYQEVKEQKHCSLHEVSTAEGGLLRVVRLLKIRVIAEVNKCKRVLMEKEQYDPSGRKRALGQLIVKKMCEDEDWRSVISSAIASRIGVAAAVQDECFEVDEENVLHTEEIVNSKGFAGIKSKFNIITVSVYVTNPELEELECIGLPRGNDFVSKEFKPDRVDQPDDKPDLHVWSWVPAGDEQDVRGNVTETALEVTNRDLYDVEHILTQTIQDNHIQSLGLDRLFRAALQKLKKCAELLSNIDKTMSSVQIGDIMGTDASETNTAGDTTSTSALKSFIVSNFVRTQNATEKEEARKDMRRMSFTDNGLDAGDAETFSLDKLFAAAPSEYRKLLEGRNNFSFDLFDLSKNVDDNTHLLQLYGEVMLSPFLHIAFNTTEESAHSFVEKAALGYKDNPYHGPMHAAQVCHLSRWLTKAMHVMKHQSELEATAFMVAAFCHDIKHIGRNNNFCVVSEHPLALLYNNSSVLENFHSSTCLTLMDSSQVLKQLSLQERAKVRSHIIENILATDMAEHFETISKFRVRRDAKDLSPQAEDDRRFLAKLCLKAGDLGHATLPWNLHLQWSIAMTKEFYAQGDEEKRCGLPISALCDSREVNNLSRSQKGFLDFVVAPLFNAMSENSKVNPCVTEDDDVKRKRSVKARRVMKRVSETPEEIFSMEDVCIKQLGENARHWQEDVNLVPEIKAALGLWEVQKEDISREPDATSSVGTRFEKRRTINTG